MDFQTSEFAVHAQVKKYEEKLHETMKENGQLRREIKMLNEQIKDKEAFEQMLQMQVLSQCINCIYM